MRCLHASAIINANNKSLVHYGGISFVRDKRDINGLRSYVSENAGRYGFDEIETICLAAYQIVKLHPFGDGNKRTASIVLLNCLRKAGRKYTGRQKDLADEIINMATSDSKRKKEAILALSYFLKHRLQDR